ncbi:MAG TPA: AraC family transcriptional regulator [Xanthobacteraceae bacterium]|jgi:AraC-like DNA-binding protein
MARALMGIGMNIKPLDGFPFIRTTDVEEMREAITKTYGANKLQLRRGAEGFHARANHRLLRNIVLSYVTFGAVVDQEFQAFAAFAQPFRIRGSSEIIVDRTPIQLTPDQSLIMSPETRIKMTHSHDLEHCVLGIGRHALLNKLTALTGRQPLGDLKFEPVANSRTPEATYLRRLFMFLVDQLDSSEGGIPPLALAELEQSVIVAFLCANRHDESHLLDREPMGTAPWQVRRAEEYIEAHWDQPIIVEALAVATGASARSIFHFFKASRGYGPMVFVKQVRLRHARQMLMMPDETTSVTSVAFDCGFTNLSHFAKNYGKCFGELPSETLNRTKGAAARPTVKAA